ncbi:head-tail connector protein [Larkinella humicola]|uniref:Phage gp6-like head-tail connector protein n=1 Tax=Larkinella humicola TaxID=2607654 RepID=A0A5N1JTV8_9BACT|nr:head-tail connector protein [Larkinella humicola]KAA9357233.1 phage gp6-like head-tail connector protein [Larkinella humicola]
MTTFTHEPADPAAALPTVVSLEDACSWVKVADDDPDVPVLIQAAMGWIEDFCCQPIFNREFVVTLRGFENGCFDSLYVTEITRVEYQVKGETEITELVEGFDFELFDNALHFHESLFVLQNVDRVEIRFKAGPTPLPPVMPVVIRLCVADWYDNRADSKRAAPSAVENLLKPYKLMHF